MIPIESTFITFYTCDAFLKCLKFICPVSSFSDLYFSKYEVFIYLFNFFLICRLRLNVIHKDYLIECVERDYVIEKKAAAKEFEEKKIELRETLISDMEEKRKLIESERHTMELTGDSMEVGLEYV